MAAAATAIIITTPLITPHGSHQLYHQLATIFAPPSPPRPNFRCQHPRGCVGFSNSTNATRVRLVSMTAPGGDGTLNDVRTALDDRLKGIRMKYLPQTIWRRSDKERAASMIQAIDKQLKTRRIMRILEKLLVGDCTRVTSGCYNGPYDLSYN
nr:hypothetical protein [Tanacetum cinerariifolium]